MKRETITLTPTWVGLIPALVQVAANAESLNARDNALAELKRCAQTVDDLNERGRFAANPYRLEIEQVIHRMRSRGNAFEGALAYLLVVADEKQRSALLAAFSSLFLDHLQEIRNVA